MALTKVTIRGKYVQADGVTPASGRVTFRLAHPILDSAGAVIAAPIEETATIQADGTISIDLVATDDDGVSPSGNTYVVSERVSGAGNPRVYSIEVPNTSSTLDLSTVVPATTTPSFTYALQSALTQGLADAADDATTKASAAQATSLAAVDDLAYRNQATFGQASEAGGVVTISYRSNWGINDSGNPYYDAAGAVDGEEAALIVGTDGALNLVTIGG